MRDGCNLNEVSSVIAPEDLKSLMPAMEAQKRFVEESRNIISDIISGDDHRFLIIVGPCSIHDIEGALDYARQLKRISSKFKDKLFVVMRVYLEKPRTSVGWKGLVNDPDLDDSRCVEKGLLQARRLLLSITELGLPTATEALDPLVPHYIQDLVSWVAIGARTSESQTHRELASGLSTVVGFKNSTDGDINVAINAMKAAASSHSFLGLDSGGNVSIVKTCGNKATHVILRGGTTPNYDPQSVKNAERTLRLAGLNSKIVIDCSHANSGKLHTEQKIVLNSVMEQLLSGNKSIKGCMLESYLKDGNQSLNMSSSLLDYGVSITDKCLNIKSTEHILDDFYTGLCALGTAYEEGIV